MARVVTTVIYPSPEPSPVDCAVCCKPTAPAVLITCTAEGECDYSMCPQCVLDTGGCPCTVAGCMKLHYKCPACRQHAIAPDLTDDRYTKQMVLQSMNTLRANYAAKTRRWLHILGHAAEDMHHSLPADSSDDD